MIGQAFAAILAMAAITGGDAPGAAGPLTLTPAAPVELCLGVGAPERADLAAGRRRGVLVLHEVSTDPDGAPLLKVTADTGETTQIGLFPAGPFRAATSDQAQRYFLPGSGETRCWDVAMEGGGSARISLELSDPLE